MKIPKYITRVEVVRTKKGIYTPFIEYSGVKPSIARRWLNKNGWRLMESLLGRKIPDFKTLMKSRK